MRSQKAVFHPSPVTYLIQLGPNRVSHGAPRLRRVLIGAGELVNSNKLMENPCSNCKRGLNVISPDPKYAKENSDLAFFGCSCFDARMKWWAESWEFRKLMEKLECLSA